jgi:hypothetical protein
MIDIIKTSSMNISKKSGAPPMCICKRDPTDKSIKTTIIHPEINGKKLNNNALIPYLNPNLLRTETSRQRLTSNKAPRRAKAMI